MQVRSHHMIEFKKSPDIFIFICHVDDKMHMHIFESHIQVSDSIYENEGQSLPGRATSSHKLFTFSTSM